MSPPERRSGCREQQHYPPEFKREAVMLYRSSGKSIPKMAEDLVIASESLRRWIRQHEGDA